MNEILEMNPTQEAEKKNSTKENNPHLKLDIKTDGVRTNLRTAV